MASKSAPKNTNTQYVAPSGKFVFILGLAVSFIGFILLIALVSFLWSGAADRSIFDMGFLELLKDNNIRVNNLAGKAGAWISDMLVTNGVGLTALSIPFATIAVGLWILGIRKIRIGSILWTCFLFTVWGSVTLGFITMNFSDSTYLLCGGLHGYYVSRWLTSWIGGVGTFILLATLLLVYLTIKFPYIQSKINSLVESLSNKHLSINWSKINQLFNGTEPDDKLSPATSPSAAPTTDNNIQPQNLSGSYINDDDDDNEEDDNNNISINNNPDNVQNTSTSDSNYTMPANTIDTDTDPDADNGSQPDEPAIDVKDTTNINDSVNKISNPNDDPSRPYDPTLDLSDYKYPSIDLLIDRQSPDSEVSKAEMEENAKNITTTLKNFGITIDKIHATIGPTVTLYELVPSAGMKLSKIKSLQEDIAMNLAAMSIRMIAPMPGKGTVGIEVPNKNKKVVSMYSMIMSDRFQKSKYELPIALGKTITNETFVFDLASTPHLLVAGATGQGKSVGLNVILTSLLYKKHPSQIKFVIIDPKQVEFTPYAPIEKNFLAKLPDCDDSIITNVEDVKSTLSSLTIEMENRYTLLSKAGLRNIKEYNAKFIERKLLPTEGHRFLPYIVVIIDEFGDLIMTAGKEIEQPIARIAQKARAIGIHMILATQRPDVKIITGVIKANFPSRIAFKVSAMIDSRTILDESGAQHLSGKGDLLAKIAGTDYVTRVQCAFVDTDEVVAINDHIAHQQSYACAYELPEPETNNSVPALDFENDGAAPSGPGKLDEHIRKVAEMVVNSQQGSTSNIQRLFNLGYNRSGRIMDQLERMGIVGPANGSKPRSVLVNDLETLESILQSFNV
ncbi:MAG: DNA translocase FtsK [Bacteroidales bacterium]|nr:DNA translocase FtsK [Bacteroidales bacterium]